MTWSQSQASLLRSLAWCETLGYAPTRVELARLMEQGQPLGDSYKELATAGAIREVQGRVGFSETCEELASRVRERDFFQPRKLRRARRVARYLSLVPGIRLVALANTTAIGMARDEGDVDFFLVVRAGTIWQSRLVAGFPFRLSGLTPTSASRRDAVCLSYFIADDSLNLASHTLGGRPQDDPYFCHWFLSLLPLYDDGISRELWEANTEIRASFPSAQKWACSLLLRRGARKRFLRIPLLTQGIESLSRIVQMRWFPPEIRARMNRDTTVIVSNHALKFHLTDRREAYRRAYEELCRKRQVL